MTSRITGRRSLFDFVQDTKPGNPSYDGATWLRTTDYTAFSYDLANNRWLSFGESSWDASGQNGVASGDVAGQKHDIAIGTLKAWIPYHGLLFTSVALTAANIPDSSHEVRLRDGAATRAVTSWDGSTNQTVETLSVEQDANGSVFVRYFAGSGTQPDSWQVVYTYKLRVAGD